MNFLFLMFLISYLKAMLTSPGFVGEDWKLIINKKYDEFKNFK